MYLSRFFLFLTLSEQILVELFLDIVGNLARNGTKRRVSHARSKRRDKFDILLHMLGLHYRRSVIAVVNRRSVSTRKSSKRDCGNTLVRKGCRITRVNVLISLYLEAKLIAKVAYLACK